jgi:hypothetical protein
VFFSFVPLALLPPSPSILSQHHQAPADQQQAIALNHSPPLQIRDIPKYLLLPSPTASASDSIAALFLPSPLARPPARPGLSLAFLTQLVLRASLPAVGETEREREREDRSGVGIARRHRTPLGHVRGGARRRSRDARLRRPRERQARRCRGAYVPPCYAVDFFSCLPVCRVNEISCLCSRRRPSLRPGLPSSAAQPRGGRSVAETEPNFLLGGDWLLTAGPPFSCPNANASSLVIIFSLVKRSM